MDFKVETLLLTGHSGFLGRILCKELSQHSEVYTLGHSEGLDTRVDLSLGPPVLPQAYDRVVHNAGKAHIIPKSAPDAQAFYNVNVQGTKNLLKALEGHPPRQFVMISTVAVYGREPGEEIDESHALLGESPYARSKIQAEVAVQEWCEARGVHWLILRLPLVVGPQPPGNLGAILHMIASGRYIRIKGNQARKSIVRGGDVARLIGSNPHASGIYNLTDGIHPRFCDLEDALSDVLQVRIRYQWPKPLFKSMARTGDVLQQIGLPFPMNSDRFLKMTSSLTFDDGKARRELGWNPRPVLDHLSDVIEPRYSLVEQAGQPSS